MLTQYESILAVPDKTADFGYRFYAAPFQAGAQTTVSELAELTFRYHIPKECSQDGEAPDCTQIARISRTDLACYMYSGYNNRMGDANDVRRIRAALPMHPCGSGSQGVGDSAMKGSDPS